ncbi:MAG: hypothetical protein JW882_15015, partial [Deltaproteobacteria bacterium]|nr:hypothetical protein [Deltaproteobacteria bacterium]
LIRLSRRSLAPCIRHLAGGQGYAKIQHQYYIVFDLMVDFGPAVKPQDDKKISIQKYKSL